MAKIHLRMPVILPQAGYSSLLSRDPGNLDNLIRLLYACSSENLTAVRVSTVVNSPAHDTAECLQPLTED